MNERSEVLCATREMEDQIVSRREMLRLALAGSGALVASQIFNRAAFGDTMGRRSTPAERRAMQKPEAAAPKGPHKLPPLPYSYSALTRAIDTTTMRIHHDKHHKKYVDELNKVVAANPSLRGRSPQSLIMNLGGVPESIRDKVRNNGGGHVNHSMFWTLMSPRPAKPSGQMAQVIQNTFGSLETFQTKFNDAGVKRFGSGWVWLVNNKGRFEIISTPNQDNPLMMGMYPILGNDVWEHAYYLRYQNKRPDYLKAWWSVVNWPEVNRRLAYMNSNWMKPGRGDVG